MSCPLYLCHLFNHSPRQPQYGHCGHSLYCPYSLPHSSPVSPPTPWDCICNVERVGKLNFITSHVRQVNITVKTFRQLWYSKQQLYTATHSQRTQASFYAIRIVNVKWLILHKSVRLQPKKCVKWLFLRLTKLGNILPTEKFCVL